jgi:hypothetical protein
MRRIAALLLVTAVWPGAARSADPTPVPTKPQVPAPVLDGSGSILPVSGLSDRVLAPIRERTGAVAPGTPLFSRTAARAPADTPPAEPPAGPPCAGSACGAPGCGTPLFSGTPLLSGLGGIGHGGGGPCGAPLCPGTPLKSWLCFRPTTGKALPKLNPHPYVGPVTGIFPCTSCAGYGVGCAGPGCAGPGCVGADDPARSRLGLGLTGRAGCKGGTCVPPAEDAFPGYRFATPESPAVPGHAAVSGRVGSTSYKPAEPPGGLGPVPSSRPVRDAIESLGRPARP